jgi:hypothetical protein
LRRGLARRRRWSPATASYAGPFLQGAFEEYGLPLAIRSDKGPPFASRAPGGVSRFSVLLIKIGVRPERIEKGRPTHEALGQVVPAKVYSSSARRFTGFMLRDPEYPDSGTPRPS